MKRIDDNDFMQSTNRLFWIAGNPEYQTADDLQGIIADESIGETWKQIQFIRKLSAVVADDR